MSVALNELKKVVRSLLISVKSDAISLRQLESMYEEIEGRKIPLYGHADLWTLLTSMSDTVYTKMHNGQLMLYPIETQNTKHILDMVAEQRIQRPRRNKASTPQRFPRGWFANDSDGFCRNSNGRASNAPRNSRGRNNRYNQNNESSYRTPRAVAQNGDNNNNNNKNKNKINFNTNRYNERVHNEPKPIEEKQSMNYAQTNGRQVDRKSNESLNDIPSRVNNATNEPNVEQTHIAQLDSSESSHFIDHSIFFTPLVQFGIDRIELSDNLPELNFCDRFKIGQSFRIFLSQIHSPYKFWFHLNEHSNDIERLMSRLEHFYREDGSPVAQKPIPDDYLTVGRFCAALYQDQWHRARIIDVFGISVKVFYIDYGTIAEVAKENIRFLEKSFSKPPSFAVRGCLDRVKPNRGIWSLDAMVEFNQRLEAFFSLPILAKVTGINATEKTLYLDLIDTTGAIDLKISSHLIECNYAYPTKKPLAEFQKRHFNEIHPSFERLENGKYPSLDEIKHMEEEGFNFWNYEFTIINPELYGYETIE